MPLHVKDHPWIKIDHINGMLTCNRCREHEKVSVITGLEGIVDAVRPFARQHAHKEVEQHA